MTTEQKVTITVQELAAMLGMSIRHTYKMIYEGKIPARQLGSKWIISRNAITKWLEDSPAVPVTQREGYFSDSDYRPLFVGAKAK